MVVASYLIKFRGESLKHFMAKSCLFYMLRELKHDVISEFELPETYIDLCDKTTMTFYEFELTPTSPRLAVKVDKCNYVGYDLIIIDCREMPDDIYQMRMFLEKFFVPD